MSDHIENHGVYASDGGTTATGGSAVPLRRLGPFLFLGSLGFLVTASVNQTLIQQILAEWDPLTKVAHYSMVSLLGSLTQMVGSVVFGTLSDRTTSRFGRRNPWLLGGGFAAAACMAAISFTDSFPALLALWLVGTTAVSAFTAPAAAILPDRIAENPKAPASMIAGLGQMAALVLNGFIVAALLADAQAGLRIAAWPIALAGLALFFGTKDRQVKVDKGTGGIVDTLRALRPPRSKDLYLVLAGRFFLMLAIYSLFLYQLYLLTDYIGTSTEAAGGAMALFGVFLGVLGSGSAIVAGVLSDKWGRRKPFVYLASGTMALSFVPFLFSATVTSFYLWAALLGLSYGLIISVDQALVVDVLPNKNDGGRDLGIANLANTVAAVLAPGLVGVLLTVTGSYQAVFIAGIVLSVAAAACIGPIRSAR
ncbi:MAG: MFS transporter [Bifidobacteriaceae bacterium]|jgi:MFS family permease|nr:MFS transporter [Bifidobacteriaceae bacterium]